KLPTESRPKEAGSWIRKHIRKRHEPTIVDSLDFGRLFCTWWTSLQPSWRILDDGEYSKDTPADDTWTTLRKGGAAGMHMVIIGLSWW
ncbi:hypothetical protein BDQ17DRAFT_1175653, partial [Cyathus striatus]